MKGTRAVAVLAVVLLLVVGAGLWFGLSEPATVSGGGTAASPAPGVAGGDPLAPGAPSAGLPRGARPGTICGRVVLFADSSPVPGVIVEASRGEAAALRAVTAADGRFRVADVPAGDDWRLAVAHGDFARVERAGVLVEPGRETDVGTLLLSPAVRLLVRVLDGADRPLPGAKVEVFAGDAPVYRFDRGSWRDQIFAATRLPVALRAGIADARGETVFEGLAAGWYAAAAIAEGCARGGDRKLAAPGDDAPLVIRLGRGFALRGRVLDADGNPVAARVVLGAGDRRYQAGFGYEFLRQAAATDAEGAYAFAGLRAGAVTLLVERPGAPAVDGGLVRIPEISVFDIHLGAGAALAGIVREEGGAPVAGAEVRAAVSGPSSVSPTGAIVLTGEDGRFRAEGLPAGAVSYFEVTAAGFARHPPPNAAQQPVFLTAGEETEVEVVLVRGGGVTGKVTLAGDGSPVPRARVSAVPPANLWDTQEGVLTGEDGRYRLAGLAPGEYLLSVEADGCCQPGFPNPRMGRPPDGESAQKYKVRIDAGGAEVERDLVVERGAVVAGRVEDGLNQPVGGARVWVTSQSSPAPALTGADGAFRVTGLGEAAQAYVMAEGDGQRAQHGPVSLPAGGEVSGIVLKLTAGGVIAGRVEMPDGSPPPGGEVWTEGQQRWWDRSAGGTPLAEDGTFRLAGVTAGQRVVAARVPGYPIARSDPVTVAEGAEVAGIRLRLVAGLTIAGRVETPDGAPVAGALIGVYGPGIEDGATMAQTGPDGKFTLSGLAPGQHYLTARREGLTTATRQGVDPQDGEVVVLVVSEGGEISGRVLTETGDPAPGVLVTLGTEGGNFGGTNMVATSGRDGAFRLRGLPDAAYVVTAAPPGWTQAGGFISEKREGVRPGDPPVVFRLRTGLSIAGRVRGVDGAGAAGVRVTASNQGAGQDAVAVTAVTAADGAFAIAGLPAGEYTVLVEGWQLGLPEVSVSDVPAGTEGLDLALGAAREIEGTVLDAEGRPVEGAQVTARPATGTGGSSREAQSGPDGSFTLPQMAPGTYRVTAALPGRFRPATADDVPAGTSGVTLELAEGLAVTGIVVTEDGTPLPNVGVTVADAPPGLPPAAAQSGDDGKFSLAGLAPGPVRLSLLRQQGWRLLEPVTVEAGAKDVRLTAAEAPSIRGTVVDRQGRGVAGASVFTRDGDGVWARTDDTGAFHLKGLAEGEILLQVFGPTGANAQVKARAGESGVEIRLP